MKALPYLLSGALIAPGAVLAYGFWTLSEAIRQGNIFKFLYYLLVQLVQMLNWGMWIVAAVILMWVALAFIPKYRWLGAALMAVVAILSLVEFFAATGLPKEPGQLFFPVLSLGGLALNIWLVWDGFPTESKI